MTDETLANPYRVGRDNRPVCHRTDEVQDGNGRQLEKVWSKARMIGKPAREKETFRAFRALLFGRPSPRTASPGE
jgi:hypothetical protein